MYKVILNLSFLLAILVAVSSFGQKKEKANSYQNFKNRSSRSNTEQLLREADDLKTTNPDEALNKVQEALGMSLAQQDAFNEGKAYVVLGEINEGILEWKLALENYTRAYEKLSGKFTSSPEYRKTLQGLGNANLKLGNYEESLKYFEQTVAIPKSNSDAGSSREELQLSISEVYYQMGRYEEALQAIVEPSTSRNDSNRSYDVRVQNQKAKVYARLNEFDQSKRLYQNSINTLRSNKSVDQPEQQSLQNAKEEIVDVLRGQNRPDDEISLRKQSIEFNQESKNMTEVTKDKVEISKTLESKGKTTAAIKEMEEAALIADSLDNPKEQANAYLALADLYEKNGRTTQALSAYKKYSSAITKNEALNETRLEERSKLIKKQKDIEELTKDVSIGQREDTIEQAVVFRQELVIYGLLLIIVIIAVTSYFIYRNARASQQANQLLALKSLRSQMNPHFIFNALNSVNHFIAQQDERTANKFLSDFSQLMRLVLEYSQEDFISLQKEQEILSLYLKLEHYRFRDKFDYEIDIDKEINADVVEVPPMLIQPYIENAVWHGLRYKEAKGKLSLRIRRESHDLVVEITDDGIGRKKSAELKTENQKKHNSTGLKNIRERLEIINKVYKANYRVSIHDLAEGSGTKVQIYLPINNRTAVI